ncbi:phage tail protein [Paenibacillus kandeliae]|uniref:phage tail protein n=1 Tax=Paenibacillus kandeliae TaxID=3231269 RepID=UPI003458DE3D
MADPFIGEIRMFAFGTIPQGWIQCNGQLLAIASNTALFSLLSITYGGDGRTTFGVPDLRGCVPVHPSANIALGKSGGEIAHALTINEMPTHNHMLQVSDATSTSKTPKDNFLAATTTANSYAAGATSNAAMTASTISTAGAGAPHTNMQPYLTFSFCIATIGIYPPHP